jgi:hypothetical protein
LSRLSNTQANGSDGNDTLSQTLKGELERALATIKQKRLEAQQFQSEIEQLRGELNAARAHLSLNKVVNL